MNEIKVEKPSPEALARLRVSDWPIWTKEVSQFPWTYTEAETCYLLTGDVVVTPLGGVPVKIGVGDLATFPAGLRCHWDVRAPVRKHYRFGK